MPSKYNNMFGQYFFIFLFVVLFVYFLGSSLKGGGTAGGCALIVILVFIIAFVKACRDEQQEEKERVEWNKKFQERLNHHGDAVQRVEDILSKSEESRMKDSEDSLRCVKKIDSISHALGIYSHMDKNLRTTLLNAYKRALETYVDRQKAREKLQKRQKGEQAVDKE